jgi:hypothetical protein
MEKDLPVIGRPKKPIADVPEKTKHPWGRPRKENPPKVPGRRGRPRKLKNAIGVLEDVIEVLFFIDGC